MGCTEANSYQISFNSILPNSRQKYMPSNLMLLNLVNKHYKCNLTSTDLLQSLKTFGIQLTSYHMEKFTYAEN